MNLIYPERMFPHFRSEACLFSPHTQHVGQGWICGRHVHHTMLEMLLVLNGHQTTILGSTEYEQHAGDLIIISPMQVHDFQVRHAGSSNFFTMHFYLEDSEFLHWIGAHNKSFYSKDHPLNAILVPSIQKLLDLLMYTNAPKMAVLREVYTILGHLEEYFSSDLESEKAPAQIELPALIAREIQKLVSRKDAQELPDDEESSGDWLEDISHRLGVSRRHCHRIFSQAFGIPPREYLMVLKQQEAMYMLATSSETIEQIAYRIGYENVQSFSRQFTAWAGCSPSFFRKNNIDQCHHLTPIDAG
ncbi:Transposon Tn10 TetD protein [compost metagenome]